MAEPLSNEAAQRKIRDLVATGAVRFSGHALRELVADGLTTDDAVNTLKAGFVELSEEINRDWRYRVRTNRMVVVVALVSEVDLRVVTAWKL